MTESAPDPDPNNGAETAELEWVEPPNAKTFGKTAPGRRPDAGAELAEELKKPDPEAWHVDRRPKRSYVEWGEDVDRIASSMVVSDPLKEYDRLERELQVGDNRFDSGHVLTALDQAEANARMAFRVYVTLVRDVERWRLENAEVFGTMRREATQSLQAEKEAKSRNKTITEADIEAECAVMFSDQWTDQEMRKLKAKQVVESARNLLELWTKRAMSLTSLASKLR